MRNCLNLRKLTAADSLSLKENNFLETPSKLLAYLSLLCHIEKNLSRFFFGQLPYRKLCLAELILKIGIDLRTIKQKIHAAVQPQHDHDKRRQTSVHIAEVREECKVQRKKVGEQRPCDCYDKRSRNLTLKRSLPVWQIPIQY